MQKDEGDSMVKKIFSVCFIICFTMIISLAICEEELPEDSMSPDYTPDNVKVPEESLEESIPPVNESEMNEEAELKNDEERENRDYNTFEGEINEIQNDEKALTRDE